LLVAFTYKKVARQLLTPFFDEINNLKQLFWNLLTLVWAYHWKNEEIGLVLNFMLITLKQLGW